MFYERCAILCTHCVYITGVKCGLRQKIKKKGGTEHSYYYWPSHCETNNKIKKKGQSANSIGDINICRWYWRRHAERERECRKTGFLKSSRHMNPANRAKQEILAQWRDKFNLRKMERVRDYSVLMEEEEEEEKKKEGRNGMR